eukprot:1442467-Pyramimonas_sp.AAC.1
MREALGNPANTSPFATSAGSLAELFCTDLGAGGIPGRVTAVSTIGPPHARPTPLEADRAAERSRATMPEARHP